MKKSEKIIPDQTEIWKEEAGRLIEFAQNGGIFVSDNGAKLISEISDDGIREAAASNLFVRGRFRTVVKKYIGSVVRKRLIEVFGEWYFD